MLTKPHTPAALSALSALFSESIPDLVNWLLEMGDDLVSLEMVVLPRAALALYLGRGCAPCVAKVKRPFLHNGQIVWGYQSLVTNLLHHFPTVQKGGGGHCAACFDVERNPPLPGGVTL